MKNIFFSFFFLLVSNFGFGQIEWVGNQSFTEEATRIVPTSQGQYILVNNNSYGATGLTVFDNFGNIIFEDRFQNSNPSFYEISDIVELNDSSIVFGLASHDCHGNWFGYYKYNKNWELIGIISDITAYGPAVGLNDGSFIMCSPFGQIEKWSSNLGLDWSYETNNEIKDIIKLTNDTLLIATNEGLIKMDTSGNFIGIQPTLIFERLESLTNGNFLAQNGTMLHVFSPSLTIIGSFQQPGFEIKDFISNPIEITVLTSDSKLHRFNTTLQPISSFVLTGQNQTFNTLALQENGYLIGGGVHYGNTQHGNNSYFLSSYGLDGNTFNNTADIGVVKVSPITNIDVSNGPFNDFFTTFHDIKAEVKNFGSSPVNELSLNIQFPSFSDYYDCVWSQGFSKSFSNLNLQPGASVLLTFGTQHISGNSNLAGPLNFCMWTSLPDNRFDTNNDNDVACTQVTVAAHERIPVAFSHHFDPVSDELHLELKSFIENEKTEAHIFNAAGQLVYSEAITGQRQTIELAYLPDGAYFLQIVSGQRVGWGKFAKY